MAGKRMNWRALLKTIRIWRTGTPLANLAELEAFLDHEVVAFLRSGQSQVIARLYQSQAGGSRQDRACLEMQYQARWQAFPALLGHMCELMVLFVREHRRDRTVDVMKGMIHVAERVCARYTRPEGQAETYWAFAREDITEQIMAAFEHAPRQSDIILADMVAAEKKAILALPELDGADVDLDEQLDDAARLWRADLINTLSERLQSRKLASALAYGKPPISL